MQQDKSTVALALVGVLALTIIGIVVGEIMERTRHRPAAWSPRLSRAA